jgi:hypothetical protein
MALSLTPFGLPPLAGQEALVLDLVTDIDNLVLCNQSQEVRVSIQLDNPSQLPVGGFQLALEFAAEHFALVDFEPGEATATFSANGPPPFGVGFADCGAAGTDAWDDGLGSDLFSVAASVFSADRMEPLTSTAVVLGIVVFKTVGNLPGDTSFSIPSQGCPPLLETTAAVFDVGGEILVVEFRNPSVTVGLQSETRVRDFTCALEPEGAGVALSWAAPESATQGDVSGYVVYKNGEVLSRLVLPSFTSLIDAGVPTCQAVNYEVAVIKRDVTVPCRASCQVSPDSTSAAEFLRGDNDGDGRLNISDAIATLRFLFQGVPIDCLDAADFNDSGDLELADAVASLSFTFSGGNPPAPPYPQIGLDPTDDPFCCR